MVTEDKWGRLIGKGRERKWRDCQIRGGEEREVGKIDRRGKLKNQGKIVGREKERSKG